MTRQSFKIIHIDFFSFFGKSGIRLKGFEKKRREKGNNLKIKNLKLTLKDSKLFFFCVCVCL